MVVRVAYRLVRWQTLSVGRHSRSDVFPVHVSTRLCQAVAGRMKR
jgi:hypothetical protein